MAFSPPDPGEMREVVGIEYAPAFDDKRDVYNATEPDWRGVPGANSRRAKVEQLSGREFWQAQQTEAAFSIRVTIRYFEGLMSKRYRFVWRGMILNIGAAINPDNKKIWHECMCTARAKPAQPRA
mgnify:CR=1 FL=1